MFNKNLAKELLIGLAMLPVFYLLFNLFNL